MNKKILFTSLIFILTFNANSQDWFGRKKIKGNGNVVRVNRKVASFDAVSSSGSFDVVVVKGKEIKITIEGEKNIIPFIETEVLGNTLKINFQKNINIKTTKRLRVTVAYQSLKSVTLGGSGNILGKNLFKADNFNVSVAGSGNVNIKVDANSVHASIGGSGNIDLEGKSNEFTCSIAGSGSIRAYELKTDEVHANIAGSGSIKTTVKTKIKAKLVGSGSVYYKGNPKYINNKSVGSGSIIDRN